MENISKHYPYSVVSLATVLQMNSIPCRIVDSRFDEDYEKQLALQAENIQFVGISVMTGYQIIDGLRFSRYVKKIAPDAKIAWGGWHPSLLPEQTLVNELIDIIVTGPGEPAITNLVEACRPDGNLDNVPNILYKKNGEIRKSKHSKTFTINEFPQPNIELLNVEDYIHPSELGNRTIFYYSSQGCPFRCAFCCDMAVFKRRWQCRSADEVYSFLLHSKNKYRVDSVNILDTNFFIDRKRIEDIACMMVEEKLEMKWVGSVRTDQVIDYSEDFLKLIKESGCQKLYIGAESGSDETLLFIEKDATVKQTYETAEKLSKAGIIAEFFIMSGFPVNPGKDLDLSLSMIWKLKNLNPNHQFTPFLYTPYPGTPLFQRAIEYGLKPPDKLEGWGNWSVLNVHTPWIDDDFRDKFYSFVKYYYPMAFPSDKLAIIMKRKWIGCLLRSLKHLCEYRLKNDYFNFRWDWKLVKCFNDFQKKYGKYWVISIR